MSLDGLHAYCVCYLLRMQHKTHICYSTIMFQLVGHMDKFYEQSIFKIFNSIVKPRSLFKPSNIYILLVTFLHGIYILQAGLLVCFGGD